MERRPVDLSAHINQTVERGHPADFPVVLRPIFVYNGSSMHEVPRRLAVVRPDTGEALAVVSTRYTLVPHARLLDTIQRATQYLDVGPVPRGVYVDRRGARMRALFKFPALARPVLRGDAICPSVRIQNTYDGTSRIALHIGAFRFVCTNLAVGGGGVFAGGFMSVHVGEIPVEEVAARLGSYLSGFEAIVAAYRRWTEEALDRARLDEVMDELPRRAAKAIRQAIVDNGARTVYQGYNAATEHATHRMRSYRTAFDLLDRINRGFQEHFPAEEGGGVGREVLIAA